MTSEDIIRMAREAGLAHFYDSEGHCSGITDARLINEDRERNDDRLVEMLAPFAALVAAAERSACAKVCEAMRPSKEEFDKRYYAGCTDSAAAIRARGEK